jgi:hypothetical protein
MPKKWENKWNSVSNKEAKDYRNFKLKTLGNLAIITQSLNASIRDSNWPTKKKGSGNKEGLQHYSGGIETLAPYFELNDWNETEIENRAEFLLGKAKEIWITENIQITSNAKSPNLEISKKTKIPQNTQQQEVKINSNGKLPVGKYVRKTLNELIENNLINSDEIVKLQREDYSIETFHIRYPFLRKVLISDNNKIDKYWKPIVVLNGEKYFVCSEWYEVSANNDRPYYEKWLRKMKKQSE